MKSVVRAENKTAAPGLTGAAGLKDNCQCDFTPRAGRCKGETRPQRQRQGCWPGAWGCVPQDM